MQGIPSEAPIISHFNCVLTGIIIKVLNNLSEIYSAKIYSLAKLI